MVDYILIGLGILFIAGGILGSILPFLPGPPLSYAGLLLLHFTKGHEFTGRFLLVWGIITVITYLIDYFIPIWGTRRFGGSKQGVWGSIIGLILGLFFFPPFGIIAGPFAGAVVGELIAGKSSGEALKSGAGSFAGFLLGTLIQLIAAGLMAWYFIRELFVHSAPI